MLDLYQLIIAVCVGSAVSAVIGELAKAVFKGLRKKR